MGLPEKSQHFKSSQVSTVVVNFRVNFDFQMSHGQSVPEQDLIKKTENCVSFEPPTHVGFHHISWPMQETVQGRS